MALSSWIDDGQHQKEPMVRAGSGAFGEFPGRRWRKKDGPRCETQRDKAPETIVGRV